MRLVGDFFILFEIFFIFFLGGGKSNQKGGGARYSRRLGQCGLVCPSRTSERGGEGDCVKEEGG